MIVSHGIDSSMVHRRQCSFWESSRFDCSEAACRIRPFGLRVSSPAISIHRAPVGHALAFDASMSFQNNGRSNYSGCNGITKSDEAVVSCRGGVCAKRIGTKRPNRKSLEQTQLSSIQSNPASGRSARQNSVCRRPTTQERRARASQ